MFQCGSIRLEDPGKFFWDGERGCDLARATGCWTEVLDGAPVVVFPCVVVEDLFYRFLLAFGEHVADVIPAGRRESICISGGGVGA